MATKNERRMRKIDLDAAAREAKMPEGITLTMGGVDYELPAELPLDVFDPFLTDEFDLVELVRGFYEMVQRDRDAETPDVLLALFEQRPGLHKQIIKAIKDALALLLGEEQFATYAASRPSAQSLLRLLDALMGEYGVGLGELFASSNSSVSDGATQRETSAPTSDSTSETPAESTETSD